MSTKKTCLFNEMSKIYSLSFDVLHIWTSNAFSSYTRNHQQITHLVYFLQVCLHYLIIRNFYFYLKYIRIFYKINVCAMLDFFPGQNVGYMRIYTNNTCLQKKLPENKFSIFSKLFSCWILIWKQFFPITSRFSKKLWQRSNINKIGCF